MQAVSRLSSKHKGNNLEEKENFNRMELLLHVKNDVSSKNGGVWWLSLGWSKHVGDGANRLGGNGGLVDGEVAFKGRKNREQTTTT